MTVLKASTRSPKGGLSPVFVLVGPFAEAKMLAAWAHEEFRKSGAVAFIGVDSGIEPLLSSGLPATIVIGDMDGIKNPKSLKGPDDLPVMLLKCEKERSDLGVALEFCIERGASVIYAVGFQGGRADHDFAVHLDLSAASLHVPHLLSIGEKGVVFYSSAKFSPLTISRNVIEAHMSSLRMRGGKKSSKSRQKLVSLFPIGGPARGVKLRGLRFPALDGILSLSSQGLSNEIRSGTIEVRFKQGRLALFFPVS